MTAGMEELDEGESCGRCGCVSCPERPVSWSPAYVQYLCASCRAYRVAVELSATERANAAARFAAHVAAKKT